jgi:hypothetical protein
MKPSSGNPGINKLARVMQQRMQEVNKSPLLLDFGVIQDDYSLLTNTFPIPIPKTDYLVCRDVTHDPGKPLTQQKPAKDSTRMEAEATTNTRETELTATPTQRELMFTT